MWSLIVLLAATPSSPPDLMMVSAPAALRTLAGRLPDALPRATVVRLARPDATPMAACAAEQRAARLCVERSGERLRVGFVRPKGVGGDGVVVQRTIDPDQLAEWTAAQLRNSRTRRPITSSRPARISVDGGRARALPLDAPASPLPIKIVAELEGCPPFRALLKPDQHALHLTCPSDHRTVHIQSAARTPVQVTVQTAERTIHRSLRPGESVPIATQGRRARVRCEGAGMVPWQLEFPLGHDSDVQVRCAPEPIERFVFLRTTVANARWFINERHTSGLIEVRDLQRLTLPGQVISRPEPNVWYAALAPRGPIRVCASASGHAMPDPCPRRPAAQPGEARRIDLRLTPTARPAPRRKQSQSTVIIIKQGGATGQAAPTPGPVRVGAAGGFTHKHGRNFAALGPSMVVAPASTGCLSFEGSLLFESGERPVFLERWEAETRIARGLAAARCAMDSDIFALHLALGGFVAFDIGMGPWLGAGGTIDLDPLSFEIALGVPIYTDDRLGRYGVEVLAALRMALPGGAE